jgi:hypothetical protein
MTAAPSPAADLTDELRLAAYLRQHQTLTESETRRELGLPQDVCKGCASGNPRPTQGVIYKRLATVAAS